MFCAFGLLTANAATATFDFTSSSYGLPAYDGSNAEYAANPSTITSDGVNIVFDTFTAGKNNSWRMWSDGLRAYYNGAPKFTVTAADGSNITSVSITSKNGTYRVSGESSTLDKSNNVMTWTGNQKSITFEYANSSGNNAISDITITYGEGTGGGNEGDDPVVTPPTGETQAATFNFSAPATLTPAYSATTGSTADGSTGNTYDAVSGVTFSEGAVTVTASKGTSTDARLYYQSSGAIQLRVYNGATLTVASTGTITSVEFAFNNTSPNIAYNGTAATGKSYTFENINASEAKFTLSGTSQINSITVTYAGGEEIKVAAPVVSCANNMVSIQCATDGANIYYTTNGDAPTSASTLYTTPFPISANTVVKAIAYVGTDASSVTTYNAVYEGTFTGFEAFVAGGAGTEGTVDGPITAVYQNGSYLYVVDSSNYPMLVYGSVSSSDLANGDKIASIKGKYSPYNGLPEMTNPVLGEVTKGGSTAIEPEVIAAEEVATDMVNMYVEFTDMLIEAEGTNYTMSDETGSIALYKRFNGVDMPTDLDATYTVRGFVSIYNTTIQIYPTEFIQSGTAIERVATPVFNPAGGAVEAGTKVTITTATEGANIFYTTDGTEPTIASTQYTGEIEITAAVTIKAIAVKEGFNDSSVATAAYTILDPNATEAMFNWTDETWLANEGVSVPTDASTGTNIAGTDYTVNAITVSFPANEASNVARIWRLTANSGGGVQLRVFAGDNFTVSASEGYELTRIQFECDATFQNFEPNNGTLTDGGTWAPAEATTSVQFSPSKASRINTINVTYSKKSGVSNIEADENAPVEYFNLQGVRVSNPAAGNLYIVRQGSKVSKVIVR